MKTIAWRYWNKNNPVFYVEALPGDGGVDWGYTTIRGKAIYLNKYWQRRFKKDCERVNTKAHFTY